MRTQTLVKNAIIQVDANPFKQFYQQHYGSEVGIKKRGPGAGAGAGAAKEEAKETSTSNHVKRKLQVHATPSCQALNCILYQMSAHHVL